MMKVILIFVLLTALSQAVEHEKPEQKLPEPMELPVHIQTLITNHINQVLEQKKPTHGEITGNVPQRKSAVAVPHLDLLPPHVEPARQKPQVINHQATATVVGQNNFNNSKNNNNNNNNKKVVMPPVPQIVISVNGQKPLDIGDKVNKLEQHASQVMQQAEQHIPQAINQAIKEREKLQQSQQQQQQKAARLLTNNEVEVPQLLERERELQKLGKCNFECPRQALPVCATNGKCVVEFSGQCELSQWNCFNTKNVFRQVHDDECQKTIKCYDRDMI